MRAVIIGGSGATGKALIKHLLANSAFTEVISLVRKPSDLKHPKLVEIPVDFENLAAYRAEIRGDVAYSCLGTTLKVAGSKTAQYRVDYTYQYHFAELAKSNHIPVFALVSAAYASSKSNIFYSKMKGELEEAVQRLAFEKTILFKPGSLIRPNSDRMGEKLSIKVLQALNKLGLFKNLAPLAVSDLARVILNESLRLPQGLHSLGPKEIWAALKEANKKGA